MTTDPDGELFIAGNIAELRDWYDPRLLRSFREKIGDKAEGVIDEAWAHVEKYRGNYNLSLSFRVWFFTVAFRLMKNVQTNEAIAKMMLDGLSSREVGEKLGLQYHTVQNRFARFVA